MRADQERELLPAAARLTCSWCEETVPMAAGEFSGVCISCGTVMFRDTRGELIELAAAFAPATASQRVAVPVAGA